MAKITLDTLSKMKHSGEKFACLTCYDASFARLLNDAGIELILVGDSLGNVIHGSPTTLAVEVSDIIYHTKHVSHINDHSFLVADLPFMSYATCEQTLQNAALLMRAGAHMVKLEGGAWLADSIKQLKQRGIPVCAHLGLTPQSVHALSGYRVQGRTHAQAQQIFADAKALEDSGADLLILECVPASLACDLSSELTIPVIGIGAGNGTDGQISVLYDLLAITIGKRPIFSKDFLAEQNEGIPGAIRNYIHAVKTQQFPAKEHSFE